MKIDTASLGPEGYERQLGLRVWLSGLATEVWSNEEEIVILGCPDDEDGGHNCDMMGCGQYHVLVRIRKERKEDGERSPRHEEHTDDGRQRAV